MRSSRASWRRLDSVTLRGHDEYAVSPDGMKMFRRTRLGDRMHGARSRSAQKTATKEYEARADLWTARLCLFQHGLQRRFYARPRENN